MLQGMRLWLISNSCLPAESGRLGQNEETGAQENTDRPEFSSTPGDEGVR